MRHSIESGLSFGLTSGVITTLGLMAGLYSGTNSRTAVLGAVIMVAFADGLSDALGMHVSEEAENKHSQRTVWEATFSTFFFKSLVTLTFAVPVVLFDLRFAVIISMFWGTLLLSLFSLYLAGIQKMNKVRVFCEHICIGAFAVCGAYFVGIWVAARFGQV